MSPPSVPLFPADYFGDTKHLTCEQHGAYLQLLLIAWEAPDCAIPDDDRAIARMINISLKRWHAIKPVVMAFWTLKGNRWAQGRLCRERLYIENLSEIRSAAGKLGGRPKLRPNHGTDSARSSYFESNTCGSDSAESPSDASKSLKNNDAAKAKGSVLLKQNESTLPIPLKKEEKEERKLNLVWVARDTPEWKAWQRVRRRESIWSPERQQNGFWFKSQWPPDPTPSPAAKEAAE